MDHEDSRYPSPHRSDEMYSNHNSYYRQDNRVNMRRSVESSEFISRRESRSSYTRPPIDHRYSSSSHYSHTHSPSNSSHSHNLQHQHRHSDPLVNPNSHHSYSNSQSRNYDNQHNNHHHSYHHSSQSLHNSSNMVPSVDSRDNSYQNDVKLNSIVSLIFSRLKKKFISNNYIYYRRKTMLQITNLMQ